MSTGRSVPTIVTADTQTLWKRRVLMQGASVRLHSLNDRTYPPEYCENMLLPTLVTYVTMFVTFAPIHDRARTMNSTFITFHALIRLIHLIQ